VLAIVDNTRVEFAGWLPVSEAKKKECIVAKAQNENTYNVAAESLDVMLMIPITPG
jgi:hypothetical protein